MKRLLVIGALAFLVVSLVATPATAGEKHKKVKGHVIKVEQHVRTQNGGETDRLTIRTRQGEQMQLHLGEGGACEGCFQEGDRIRAKLRASEGAGGGREVQSMKVRRGGEMYGFVNTGGTLVQHRGDRGGYGPGGKSGDRMRDRAHEPGSGDCPGCGAGRRGGGGGAGRGGGGGGRGGGGS